MITKICTQCQISKILDEFPNYKSGKYGKLARCKVCNKINQHDKYIKNKEVRIQKSKEYKLKNKEHNKKVDKARYQKQREYKLIYQKQQRENNPQYIKEYRQKNKKKISQKAQQWYKHKYHTDLSFRMQSILQKRIAACIKGYNKSQSTIQLLGCSIEDFKRYLENQFYKDPRINWKTYGPKGWHIDHIIPCSSFDLSQPNEQKKCFHYTNLQPLWWDKNIAKSNKLNYGV
jgi:hypothetical protein